MEGKLLYFLNSYVTCSTVRSRTAEPLGESEVYESSGVAGSTSALVDFISFFLLAALFHIRSFSIRESET